MTNAQLRQNPKKQQESVSSAAALLRAVASPHPKGGSQQRSRIALADLGPQKTAHTYGGRVRRLFPGYHRAAVVGSGWSIGVRGVITSGLLVACGVGLTVGCGGTTTELGAGDEHGGGGTGGVGSESDAGEQGGTGAVDAYCVPGEQRTCYDSCGVGVWTCNATGTGFSECVCPGTGGSGGVQASCSNVTPCGGDVVGTWNVTLSCLTVGGELNLSWLGVDCSSAPVTGSLQVSGTWTAYADGTYSDNTTTTGTESLEMLDRCLRVEGTCITCSRISAPLSSVGFTSVECVDNATGDPGECGLGCTCSATVDQAGGLGVAPMFPSATGTYTVAGGTLTITEGEQEYSYCVSGTTLTVTPLSADTTGTLTGTVVLQRQ